MVSNEIKVENTPPVLMPPFVARSLGTPPVNMPPRPGAAPSGRGGGADDGASALPALLARTRVFGTGGLSPALGTGGAPPTGPELTFVLLPSH
jgi:hypothetical protein